MVTFRLPNELFSPALCAEIENPVKEFAPLASIRQRAHVGPIESLNSQRHCNLLGSQLIRTKQSTAQNSPLTRAKRKVPICFDPHARLVTCILHHADGETAAASFLLYPIDLDPFSSSDGAVSLPSLVPQFIQVLRRIQAAWSVPILSCQALQRAPIRPKGTANRSCVLESPA